MNNYEDQIREILDNDVKSIELVSETSNYVYKVETNNHGIVYAKFYLNNSSHIDNELYLYKLLDNKYLKEVVVSSDNPKYANFKELKGKTLDMLSSEELSDNKEKIIDSVIYFYDTISKVKTKGYGLLDSNLNGTSNSFKDFIVERQTATEKNLSDYPILKEMYKYKTGDIIL